MMLHSHARKAQPPVTAADHRTGHRLSVVAHQQSFAVWVATQTDVASLTAAVLEQLRSCGFARMDRPVVQIITAPRNDSDGDDDDKGDDYDRVAEWEETLTDSAVPHLPHRCRLRLHYDTTKVDAAKQEKRGPTDDQLKLGLAELFCGVAIVIAASVADLALLRAAAVLLLCVCRFTVCKLVRTQ